MTQPSDALAQSKKYDFVQIRNFIETGFMHDWAISIEYAVRTQYNHIKWTKWNKTLFAIKDPACVLDEMMACCQSHPECSMKLVCEHFSPEFRFVYCIHKKQTEASESALVISSMNA